MSGGAHEGPKMLKGEIKEGEVYTQQELEALGLSDTREKFADYLIYKKKGELCIIEKLDHGGFRIYRKFASG